MIITVHVHVGPKKFLFLGLVTGTCICTVDWLYRKHTIKRQQETKIAYKLFHKKTKVWATETLHVLNIYK
jgi:hypothetical protein